MIDTTVPIRDIERIIRGYVALASGLPSPNVIPGNDNAPSPNGLYATVLLINEGEIGTNQELYGKPDAAGETIPVRVQASIRAVYSIQFYRDGAIDAARRFKKFKHTREAREYLQENNIIIKLPSLIERVDDIMSDEYEERARIEADIYYICTLDQEDVEIIDAINVDLCHNNGDNPTLEEKVEINDT